MHEMLSSDKENLIRVNPLICYNSLSRKLFIVIKESIEEMLAVQNQTTTLRAVKNSSSKGWNQEIFGLQVCDIA